MYLTDLRLTNVKLARDLYLPLVRNGLPRMWTVVIGENGACKTTILQAAALAASGPTRSNQLADAASFIDRRPGHAAHGGEVVASFAAGGGTGWSRVVLTPDQAVFGGASSWNGPPPAGFEADAAHPVESVRARNAPGLFVAGYGVDRRIPRPLESESHADPAVGRLQSLFGRGRIIGTGFADLLPDPQSFASILKDVLVGSGLLPLTTDLELRGRGGVSGAAQLVEGQRFTFGAGSAAFKLPAVWMSQGYQAIIAWVADIVGQVFWERGGAVAPSDMEGLVLVDEIDLHLHPRWQRELVPVLKEVFPKLQFIATTHSPLVLAGLEADEIVRLALDPETMDVVIDADPADAPNLMTGSRIFQSYFGVDRASPSDVGETLRRYGQLAGSGARTDGEQAEMERLRRELAGRGVEPGWEAVPRRGPAGPAKVAG